MEACGNFGKNEQNYFPEFSYFESNEEYFKFL